MTRAEKMLYHQVHPFKLLTDWTTSFASSWLLWERQWSLAAAIAWLPSIFVTVVLMWSVDLEPYRHTHIGRYVAKHMTRKIEAVRFAGQFVMWAGALGHMPALRGYRRNKSGCRAAWGRTTPWLLPLGFMIVAYGWANGLWARE